MGDERAFTISMGLFWILLAGEDWDEDLIFLTLH